MSKQIGALLSILSHYTSTTQRFEQLSILVIVELLVIYLVHHSVAFNLQGIEQDFMDLHTLTSYISYARKNIHPKLSDEAAEELTRGYVELRRRGNFPGSSKKVKLFKYIPMRGNLIVFCSYETISSFCSDWNLLMYRQVITATPRQIESLIRLSEALARIRFSEWVSEVAFFLFHYCS